MAFTDGLVIRLTWVSAVVCVYIGTSISSAETFFIEFRSSDTDQLSAFKRSLVVALTRAKIIGYPVSVGHPDDSGEIQDLTFGAFDISPIGPAIHNDSYSVSGTGIPPSVAMIFETGAVKVTVTPDIVRPHWVFIETLPTTVPVGLNTVRLESPTWTSGRVPIDVSARPPGQVRVLYSGQPKYKPYTIVFVGNPAIEDTAGTFVADAILTDRAGFLDVVRHCLENLLTETEDLLRQADWDNQFRFISVFDPALNANNDNSLAHEIAPNLMETRRNQLNPFLLRYGIIQPDIVFVLHGSTTFDRATAWFTTDDTTQAGTAYTYDGTSRTHGHFPSIPGSAALPINMNQTGLTTLHEYGHAGSDFDNGRVIDLYVDGTGGAFDVNKKFRTGSTVPIPVTFGNYNGAVFNSDPNRDGLTYPATWTSYHPELLNAANPNLMDNYWLAAGGNPQVCRLDRLTYTWFTDRLRVKLTR
jgi:hypothetical protein